MVPDVFASISSGSGCAFLRLQNCSWTGTHLDGLKRITDGELTYKIPEKELRGDQKAMAQYINRIGDGLDAAVEKSLKDERMKTELITNVSHDLKTPLTSIINYIDLLKGLNLKDPEALKYLEILDSKAHRLKSLTEDVVEASKASAGNLSLEMADLNLWKCFTR